VYAAVERVQVWHMRRQMVLLQERSLSNTPGIADQVQLRSPNKHTATQYNSAYIALTPLNEPKTGTTWASFCSPRRYSRCSSIGPDCFQASATRGLCTCHQPETAAGAPLSGAVATQTHVLPIAEQLDVLLVLRIHNPQRKDLSV